MEAMNVLKAKGKIYYEYFTKDLFYEIICYCQKNARTIESEYSGDYEIISHYRLDDGRTVDVTYNDDIGVFYSAELV